MSHGALSSYNKVGTSYCDGKEMCKKLKRDTRAKLLLILLFFFWGSSESFQMLMVVRKINIHGHWTLVTRFNPLLVWVGIEWLYLRVSALFFNPS